jgi:tetratricopeptide (TPR) repeat protein
MVLLPIVLGGCATSSDTIPPSSTRERKDASTIVAGPEVPYERGNRLAAQKRYAEAIDEYTKALRVNPTFYEALNNRGLAYYFSGQRERAIADFTKAIETYPKKPTAFSNRGMVLNDVGKLTEALSDLNRAVDNHADSAGAFYLRAVTRAKLGDNDGAITDTTEALRLDPHDADSYQCRAMAWFYKRDYQKAWEDVRACKANGGSVSPRFLRALQEASRRKK